MNTHIQQILEDLYRADETLRRREQDLIPLIEGLLAAKPEATFDASAQRQLRLRLMNDLQPTRIPSWKGLFMPVAALALLVLIIYGANYNGLTPVPNSTETPESGTPAISASKKTAVESIVAFKSEKEFSDYLTQSREMGGFGGMGMGGGGDVVMMEGRGIALNDAQKSVSAAAPQTVDRVSETNVQVLGIDEPDMVKTNGKEIYVANQPMYYYIEGQPAPKPMIAPSGPSTDAIMPPNQRQTGATRIIGVTNPKELVSLAGIDAYGDLLLSGTNLVVLSGQKINGYNVRDPKHPEKKWDMELKESNLITSRLYKGDLYIVTQKYINEAQPCPMQPIAINGTLRPIPCGEIYHPSIIVPNATTYHVFKVNPATGAIKDSLSFVGSAGSSTVYMSESALYITYAYQTDVVALMNDFLKEDGRTLLPTVVSDKIKKLAGYDISSGSKMQEFQTIIQQYTQGLEGDERVQFENELQDKLGEYLKNRQRDIQKTGIVKIGLNSLSLDAKGNVPGTPLNQYSLDEYNGNLRVATTVSPQFWMWGWNGSLNSTTANDVYVLNKDLDTIGSVKDLGVTERIYSTRFVGDRGYVVTFRQTDPFYVLDLSNPRSPQLKGELKIPGYSSYLHPIANDIILGVGQEGSHVKLSLFDVGDPANPRELDTYILDEYWTNVSNNFHAFLQDKDHGVFFIPAGNAAHIFSYKGNKLTLVKSVSEPNTQRALYINDYLYVITNDKIVVLDESTWSRVNEFPLK